MALETLHGTAKIDGFNVICMDTLREAHPEKFNPSGAMDWKWFEEVIRPHNFVYVRHDKNSLSFTLQNGPVKENGVNGCQIDTIVATCCTMLEKLNAKVPCEQNIKALLALRNAYSHLKERKADREHRGVEGTNEQ